MSTNICKGTVRTNFTRSSFDYDDVADVQRLCAETLYQRIISLSVPEPISVLDVGCGTGFMVECLLKSFSKANYTLLDFSPGMIQAAKSKFSLNRNITYLLEDVESCEFDTPFDLIVSNLSFQWLNEPQKALCRLGKMTKVLGITTLVAGTFEEWIYMHSQLGYAHKIQDFPLIREWQEWCSVFPKECLNTFEVSTIKKAYPSPFDFVRDLRQVGAQTPRFLDSFPYALRTLSREFKSNTIEITYKILKIVLINENCVTPINKKFRRDLIPKTK